MIQIEDTVKFKRTYAKRGDSMSVVIPSELGNYLELKEGEELTLAGYKGKQGKYIAVYKEKRE